MLFQLKLLLYVKSTKKLMKKVHNSQCILLLTSILLPRTLMLQLLGNFDIIKVILSQGKTFKPSWWWGENRGHKGCKGWNWRPIFQIIITIKLTTLVHHSPCLIITSSVSWFTKLMTLVYGLNHTNRLTRWMTALRISLGCGWRLWCCGARV